MLPNEQWHIVNFFYSALLCTSMLCAFTRLQCYVLLVDPSPFSIIPFVVIMWGWSPVISIEWLHSITSRGVIFGGWCLGSGVFNVPLTEALCLLLYQVFFVTGVFLLYMRPMYPFDRDHERRLESPNNDFRRWWNPMNPIFVAIKCLSLCNIPLNSRFVQDLL